MAQHYLSIDTPAILVDADILRRNIARMAEMARGAQLEHWPHTKTHKIPEIARQQMEAGSPGICVAKIGEAEVMAQAGLAPIFIANHIVGETKVARLADLAQEVEVSVCVDSVTAAEGLSAEFARRDACLPVLMEIDTGLHRCGVVPEAAPEFARELLSLPGIELVGIMTYAGFAPGGSPDEALRRAVQDETAAMSQVADALRAVGADIRRISGGSTPRARFYGAECGLTEMRPGTYVYNDVNCIDLGAATEADCALTVLATVISTPGAGRATLDAGSKALTNDLAKVSRGHGRIVECPGAAITRLDEEHAYVDLSEAEQELAVGDKVRIIPNHVCPVSNLHERAHIVEQEQVSEVLPIAARGRSQ
ncbi:MAG: alanine racemase [Armatimonadota bacterium]|jgi:D-serine deaminase-like pyridoxal phosphate-dependent protein